VSCVFRCAASITAPLVTPQCRNTATTPPATIVHQSSPPLSHRRTAHTTNTAYLWDPMPSIAATNATPHHRPSPPGSLETQCAIDQRPTPRLTQPSSARRDHFANQWHGRPSSTSQRTFSRLVIAVTALGVPCKHLSTWITDHVIDLLSHDPQYPCCTDCANTLNTRRHVTVDSGPDLDPGRGRTARRCRPRLRHDQAQAPDHDSPGGLTASQHRPPSRPRSPNVRFDAAAVNAPKDLAE
jgi:hypothetical protein